ncbi:ras guanine nucleotide exchange factor domain-containing protein [Lasiosphaeria miniovina]|uniref:Class E vacuolar protein-sorting machinery protein HSE1 n=1 Tax=Lasiosphaeria miniovina TaxID=1954250 RepID=A0AA40AW17_9PEZI|nr:ras guanine nucleotide exchange factor domain-containing protein [Lasiosphaeria miniovina]KAK0722993.1 ras guanine nucleotide exchange factor domain-containing protein [Lasiosphaeria miniovina]
MLMTQTPVSALQGQNTATTSYNSRFNRSDRLDPTTRQQPSDSTDPASLDEQSNAGRDKNYTPFFASTSTPLMNGIVGTAPPGATMYVRALYDYEADDRTSLSFHEGDVIQVITQLESGWWDGVINGVRGWFPSNYCQIITSPDELPEIDENTEPDQVEEEPEDQDIYEDDFDDEEESDHDDIEALPLEGTEGDRSRADFWIPQATPDGRLFYYNTMTGESSMELPLESPSSVTETGPRDRMNVNMPDRTRPPPEMMARGLTQDEEDESDVNSASEAEGEALMNASRGPMPGTRRSFANDGLSPSISMDSINGQSPMTRGRSETFTNGNLGQTPMIASATSFTSAAFNLPTAATIPRSFFDDGTTPPLTWSLLVTNMKKAIDRYREAITNGSRSDYVARAEDISDHLRLLLAAGSGTTDNHSGQPSIISTNKALYPHFRDMMSKFSKLVISSHIAAADWPNAESISKCLQEADGVLMGVFSYVEVARQQRGEDIPRLFPGFVIGSSAGGSWQNNGLNPHNPITSNFLEDEEGVVEPTAVLDGKLLERLDELKRMLVSSIRELDKNLAVADKVITPFKHEVIGNNVCSAGGKVLEMFKPWIAMIESIDLSSLGNSFQTPQLSDFSTNKQSLYDNISDLLLGCQAVAGPLADEWSEVRGQALEERLEYVRQCARALETNSSHIGFSLQLLSEQVQINLQQQTETRVREESLQREQPRRGETMSFERPHQRSESQGLLRPRLPLGSQSFTEGDTAAANNYRKGDPQKMRKFFGEDPAPAQTMVDDTPDFLRLDYEKDLSWDQKLQPPTVKGGSLLALVEQLTRHDKLDANFNNTFLLTYRSFTSARELFEMLVKRFGIQPPEGLTQPEYEMWRDGKQKLIRFRVVNIFKNWFDNFWMEDQSSEETKQLIRDVYNFAKDTVKSTETPGSAPLMAVLDQRLSGKEAGSRRMIQTVSQNTPAPIMPKNMKKLKFLDIDVIEFARQLTIIESRLYGKIKPTECLNKTWQKKVGEGDPEPAPNVKALILHSNQMTNWVAEMILAQTDVRKRVVVIKHFVAVADKCRTLNNFSTLTSIISALGTAPIARLKRTWDQVPQRIHATLETMRKLMASTKNFGEYREALHVANPPCIPFFGVYLTDLTFIEDGIPSIIKKTNLINFAKRAKTADVIRDIQQYQNVAYSLQPVPELQDYILSNMQAAGDVHEMYDKSLQIEPREREDEKIVRVLAESGFL